MKKSTEKLAFSGVCIALSMVLGMVKLFSLPMGGSVTACSMLFATLPGFFFGTGYGLLSGFAYGLISFFLKPEFYSPAQFVVDYIFAFSALGISGFFCNKKNGLYIGYIAACLGRFVFAFLSLLDFELPLMFKLTTTISAATAITSSSPSTFCMRLICFILFIDKLILFPYSQVF